MAIVVRVGIAALDLPIAIMIADVVADGARASRAGPVCTILSTQEPIIHRDIELGGCDAAPIIITVPLTPHISTKGPTIAVRRKRKQAVHCLDLVIGRIRAQARDYHVIDLSLEIQTPPFDAGRRADDAP